MNEGVVVERLAQLSVECTTTYATGQAAEDGTRH